MYTSSHLPGRDVASELDDDVKADSAYVYSTDPDHETNDEDSTAKQGATSDKVMQRYLLLLKNLSHFWKPHNSMCHYICECY